VEKKRKKENQYSSISFSRKQQDLALVLLKGKNTERGKRIGFFQESLEVVGRKVTSPD